MSLPQPKGSVRVPRDSEEGALRSLAPTGDTGARGLVRWLDWHLLF